MTRENCRIARREGRGEDPWSSDFFRALSDRYRRFALYYLLEHDRVSIEELATVVAGWAHATDGDVVGRERRDRIHASLLHRHLPELEAAGLVAVDRGSDSVSRERWSLPERETVEQSLEIETDRERP